MGLFEWYVVSAIVCFVIYNVITKTLEGEVSVGDFVLTVLFSLIPVVNLLILVLLMVHAVSEVDVFNKKLF